MRIGYLYSRYPVISQTFCDAEMLALERLGNALIIGSVHPPLTTLRHEHIACLCAPIHYAPPQEILKISEEQAKRVGRWPSDLVEQHARKYGPAAKAELRARNALYFASFFVRNRVDHVHVHFANRAAHTALFMKNISGVPFSVTAHGQDFMKDLGSDDLLREICAAAEFVAAETDYSRDLLRQRCPGSAAKLHRVYNGLDLERFPVLIGSAARPAVAAYQIPRIISVGRLVEFKGFEHLIDACSELARRGFAFSCEIIGDGPLRKALITKIGKLNLSSRIKLLGSLSQKAVLEKLQEGDIFALASTVDAQGATDVFPTVILEAMASALPVVSTRLAGIPELVIDNETGLLVSPADVSSLTEALAQLMCDRELRLRYGAAGRKRIEKHFRIEHTVAPLLELFEQSCGRPALSGHSLGRRSIGNAHASPSEPAPSIAYLIDRWPDKNSSLIERELHQMKKRNLPIIPFVCEFNAKYRLSAARQKIAPSFEFLPDAMVLEAEWRTNHALAQNLEEQRAQQSNRVSGGVFLRQARFALVLQKVLRENNVSHVHATSSGSLVCALLLKQLLGITVSVAIEPQQELARDWIKSALSQCIGGRVHDASFVNGNRDSFLIDKASGLQLIGRAKFWQQWADLLLRWSLINRKSTIANQK